MSGASQELKTALGEAGHRLTGPRLAVWNVLSSTHAHLTADEIASAVRADDPMANLSSVYRSLALFADLGLVRESRLGGAEATHWELAHPDEQFSTLAFEGEHRVDAERMFALASGYRHGVADRLDIRLRDAELRQPVSQFPCRATWPWT